MSERTQANGWFLFVHKHSATNAISVDRESEPHNSTPDYTTICDRSKFGVLSNTRFEYRHSLGRLMASLGVVRRPSDGGGGELDGGGG